MKKIVTHNRHLVKNEGVIPIKNRRKNEILKNSCVITIGSLCFWQKISGISPSEMLVFAGESSKLSIQKENR
jgi:hypothetical protein